MGVGLWNALVIRTQLESGHVWLVVRIWMENRKSKTGHLFIQINLPAHNQYRSGSPTNVMFGTGAIFLEIIKKALYAFGLEFLELNLCLRLKPNGATYELLQKNLFLVRTSIEDGTIGPDGGDVFHDRWSKIGIWSLQECITDGEVEKYQTTSRWPDSPCGNKLRRELEEFPSWAFFRRFGKRLGEFGSHRSLLYNTPARIAFGAISQLFLES